jgi:hypothetical protein
MPVRDFLLCTQSALQACRLHLEQAFCAWARDWLGPLEGGAGAFHCEPWNGTAAAEHAGAWLESAGPWGRAWMPADAADDMANLLFTPGPSPWGPAAGGGLAGSVAAQALKAWLAAACGAPQAAHEVAALPPCVFEPGRRLMQASVAPGPGRLVMLVEPAAPAFAAARPAGTAAAVPPARLDAVLAAHALRVDVTLGEAEVEVGLLQGLRVGDVLQLERRLDQPAQLRLGGEQIVCKAFPGQQDGQLAVELAR